MALRPIPLAVSQNVPRERTTGNPTHLGRFASQSQMKNMMAIQAPQGSKSPVLCVPTPGLTSPTAALGTQVNYLFRVPGSTAIWALVSEAGADKVVNTAGFTVNLPVAVIEAYKAVATSTQILVIGTQGIACVNIAGVSAAAIATGWNASDVAWQDGYGILSRIDTDEFYITAVGDLSTVGALDFSSADASGDRLVAVHSHNRELWLFGERTVEVWQNTGNASFPFERAQGVVINRGAVWGTVCSSGGRICWVGDDRHVYTADGYAPRRVSSSALQTDMLGDIYYQIPTAPAFAYAMSSACMYEAYGHLYYCATGIRSSGYSYVLNVDLGLWHWEDMATFSSARDDSGAWWVLSAGVAAAGVTTKVYKLSEGHALNEAFSATVRPQRYVDLPQLSAGGGRATIKRLVIDLHVANDDTLVVTLNRDAPDVPASARDGVSYSVVLQPTLTSIHPHRVTLWRLGQFGNLSIRIAQNAINYDAATHCPLVIAAVYADIEERQ